MAFWHRLDEAVSYDRETNILLFCSAPYPYHVVLGKSDGKQLQSLIKSAEPVFRDSILLDDTKIDDANDTQIVGLNNPLSAIDAIPQPQIDKPSGRIVKALHSFDPEQEDEIGIEKGEDLLVLDDSSDDWWLVRKISDSQACGLVPRSYLLESTVDGDRAEYTENKVGVAEERPDDKALDLATTETIEQVKAEAEARSEAEAEVEVETKAEVEAKVEAKAKVEARVGSEAEAKEISETQRGIQKQTKIQGQTQTVVDLQEKEEEIVKSPQESQQETASNAAEGLPLPFVQELLAKSQKSVEMLKQLENSVPKGSISVNQDKDHQAQAKNLSFLLPGLSEKGGFQKSPSPAALRPVVNDQALDAQSTLSLPPPPPPLPLPPTTAKPLHKNESFKDKKQIAESKQKESDFKPSTQKVYESSASRSLEKYEPSEASMKSQAHPEMRSSAKAPSDVPSLESRFVRESNSAARVAKLPLDQDATNRAKADEKSKIKANPWLGVSLKKSVNSSGSRGEGKISEKDKSLSRSECGASEKSKLRLMVLVIL